ncbi:MAG: DNA-processing protein DprA [Fidelibacterota bacterium]
MHSDELIALLNLMNVPRVGAGRIHALLARFKSPQDIWDCTVSDLCRAEGISQSIATAITSYRDFDYGQRQMEIASRLSVTILAFTDERYPHLLKKIYSPPIVLFSKGTLGPVREDCIAIVGTRSVTAYGKRVTMNLTESLAQNGLTIVSGLALGVDTIAHRTAVKSGGRTIAVLGSGLDRIYPAENRGLSEDIVARDGLLLSEFPFGTKPEAGNFPQRNRIISGLSHGTVVVEAGDKSGAMLTAMNAVDQNRDVFAAPGRIYDKHSVGTNRLIAHGAVPIKDGNQIIEVLQPRLFQPTRPRQETFALDLSPVQQQIVAQLQNDPIQIDELALLTKLDTTTLLSELLQLEMKGVIRQLAGKMFIVTR